MSALVRPFLVVFFALLQCMVPLLHAHAAGEVQGGVHLPGWEQDTLDPVSKGASLVVLHHHVSQEAIGVGSSLEARPDLLPPGPLALRACCRSLPHLIPLRWTPAGPPDPVDLFAAYLLPPSLAPPQA